MVTKGVGTSTYRSPHPGVQAATQFARELRVFAFEVEQQEVAVQVAPALRHALVVGERVVRAGQGELLGEGRRNAKGEEDGRGTMVYANGSVYEGEWRAGKRHGYGKHTFATGEVYEGEYVAGTRHGNARQTLADGRLVVSRYEADAKVERGVIWSADRAAAWELQEGVEARCISLDEAAQIAGQIVNGSPLPHRASAWEPSVVLDGNGMPELPDRT